MIPSSSRHSAVIGLLFPAGPASISGFIIAVIFGIAIQGEAFWPWAHVSQEVFENGPSLTDFDAAPAVLFIGIAILIAAAVKHVIPRHPFWCSVQAMLLYGANRTTKINAKATARFCRSAANSRCWFDNFDSAIATELPNSGISRPASCKFYSGEAAIPLTGRNGWEFSIVSHFSLLDRLKWLGPAGVTSTASRAAFITHSKEEIEQ